MKKAKVTIQPATPKIRVPVIIKRNEVVGKEQRYQPLTKPIDPAAKVVRNWIAEYRMQQQQDELDARAFWKRGIH